MLDSPDKKQFHSTDLSRLLSVAEEEVAAGKCRLMKDFLNAFKKQRSETLNKGLK